MSEEAFQIAEERRQAESKGERERYIQLSAKSQRTAWKDKKPFFSEQCKQRKTTERVTLEISSRKLEISKEHFIQRCTK